MTLPTPKRLFEKPPQPPAPSPTERVYGKLPLIPLPLLPHSRGEGEQWPVFPLAPRRRREGEGCRGEGFSNGFSDICVSARWRFIPTAKAGGFRADFSVKERVPARLGPFLCRECKSRRQQKFSAQSPPNSQCQSRRNSPSRLGCLMVVLPRRSIVITMNWLRWMACLSSIRLLRGIR